MTYKDRMTLNLGAISLKLFWLGKAGFNGMAVIHIPDEKLAIIPGLIMHSHHLAPQTQNRYVELDIPRWINIFEELFEGENIRTKGMDSAADEYEKRKKEAKN